MLVLVLMKLFGYLSFELSFSFLSVDSDDHWSQTLFARTKGLHVFAWTVDVIQRCAICNI